MASLFGALGSLAESYGLARQNIFNEQQKQAQARLEEERAGLERDLAAQSRARLLIEQAQARRPYLMGEPYKKDGKRMQRIWDPMAKGGQGALGEIEEGADANPLLEFVRQAKEAGVNLTPQEAFQKLNPQFGEGALQKFYRDFQTQFGHPPTEEQMMEAVYKVKPGKEKTESAEDLAYAWHYLGKAPAASDLARTTAVMRQHKWGPGRTPTGMEARTVEATKSAEDLTKDLRQFIEDNNLTKSNNWIFGPESVLSRHVTAQAYLAGHAPEDPISGRLTRMGSAIQLLGAQPYMQTRGGKYMFLQIIQHLPKMGDTPENMYTKTDQLLKIYDRIRADVTTVGAEGFDPELGEFGENPGGARGEPTPTPGRVPQVILYPDGRIEVK